MIRKGACGSVYQLCGDKLLESNTVVKGGILEDKCSLILKDFFPQSELVNIVTLFVI